MTKVVIDTNVLVSPPILAEYEAVLKRPRFSSIPAELITALLQQAAAGELVHPTTSLSISPNETDNRFYECAEAASADYIVTGNKRHFPKPHKTAKVVNPSQLLGLDF